MKIRKYHNEAAVQYAMTDRTTPRPQIRILPEPRDRARYEQSIAMMPCWWNGTPRPTWDALTEDARQRWATVPNVDSDTADKKSKLLSLHAKRTA